MSNQTTVCYVVSIELASGILSAIGRNEPCGDAVTADQAIDILKAGGVTLRIEDFERFKVLVEREGWKFASPDLEYAVPAPVGRSRTL